MTRLFPQTEATELATQAMTSPAARNKFYYNLILERIRDNDVQGALSVLNQALKQGFDVDYQDTENNVLTLLAEASRSTNVDLVRKLLAVGADPNRADKSGRKPLHIAVRSSSAPLIIQELIKAGADVNARDHSGNTVLISAVMAGTLPALQTLLAIPGIDIMATKFVFEEDQTAFDIAKFIGNSQKIKLLAPYYTTLRSLGLDYIRKQRDKFTQEQIKQLPSELQEALQGK